jgi:anti-repressor protein
MYCGSSSAASSPAAERFERWVFEEALPAIRKLNGYGATINPAKVTKSQLAQMVIDSERERAVLESKIEELSPKAEALDLIADASGRFSITSVAKQLQITRKILIEFLSAQKWIFRPDAGSSWRGYQTHIDSGDLVHKLFIVKRSDGTSKAVEQVLVTPKGVARLAVRVGQTHDRRSLPASPSEEPTIRQGPGTSACATPQPAVM